MSSSGAEQMTARVQLGRCVSAAPTSSPPFDPPEMASCSGVVHPSRISASAAAWKSSKTFCLRSQHPGPVPFLAFLAAAAQVGDRVHAARRHPGQHVRRVRGREADVEAAVAVQDRRPRLPRASASPLITSIRTGVPSLDWYVTCRAVTAGTATAPGARGPGGHRGVARVEPQHHRRRRVVGVHEPGLVPALGPLADPADGAQAGQRHLAHPLARRQVVHGDLAERVPGPAGQQHRTGRARRRPGSRTRAAPPRDPEPIRSRQVAGPGVGRVGHGDRGPAARQRR